MSSSVSDSRDRSKVYNLIVLSQTSTTWLESVITHITLILPCKFTFQTKGLVVYNHLTTFLREKRCIWEARHTSTAPVLLGIIRYVMLVDCSLWIIYLQFQSQSQNQGDLVSSPLQAFCCLLNINIKNSDVSIISITSSLHWLP